MATTADSTVWAFTPEQVGALTKLTPRQLRHWAKTGFYRPSYGEGSYFYSFRDVVALRTIAGLRATVSLQELRKVGRWLEEFSTTPWASLALYVGGTKVYLKDPKTGVFLTRVPKDQTVLPLALEAIALEAHTEAARMRKRRAEDIGHIHVSKRNAAVVAGTRVRTASVWSLHKSGATIDRIAGEYPSLGPKDIKAALQFERNRKKQSA
jgi:DNA-binding transcriptional MerR regulator